MSRFPQSSGTRGSLKWMQQALSSHPESLTNAIRQAKGQPASWTIDWRSPRANDDWAEYRDAAFLEAVGQGHLAKELAAFWPTRGPQWDALGVSSAGGVILVEAKAHLGELKSDCAAGETSDKLITSSLEAAKAAYNAEPEKDWKSGYYQYANRLAHLDFLKTQGVDATLVFLYFCGDHDMSGPADETVWHAGLEATYSHLGVAKDLTAKGVVNVFLPVSTLNAA